jgi:phosphonate transport system substrate-binding protein
MKISTKLVAAGASALALIAAGGAGTSAVGASSNVCPGGKVVFSVEPYDAAPTFAKAYKALAKALGQKLHCPVRLYQVTDYPAEIYAMKYNKVDVAEFGPLGYIIAHNIANAQPVAVFATKARKPVTYTAGIWVPNGSPITGIATLRNHTLALSSPTSTSGNLYPMYAMHKAGLNPKQAGAGGNVTIEYAGGHSQALQALVHGQVDAAEINSEQYATATAPGSSSGFNPSSFHAIWTSAPIANDPITVRGNLSKAFKKALLKAFLSLTPAQLALVDAELGVDSGPMIAASDSLYSQVRDLVKVEHININLG